MSAGARVLHHQGVHALLCRLHGLGRGGDSGKHRRSRPLQSADDVEAGQPEGETDQLHGVRQQGIDLSLPLVVVIQPQLRELHAVSPGIGPQLQPVVLELRQHRRGRRQLGRIRDEHIHAEPGAGLPDGADFRLHGRHALVAGRQEAKPAGAVHGLDEGRR